MRPKQLPPIPAGLAPMEGVTEFAARMWFRFTSSPDFLCTPFLRVTKTYPARSIPLGFFPEIDWDDAPTLPQLMATSPADFLRISESLLSQSATVEINCGCPAPNAVGRGAGSGLLSDPAVFAQTLHSLHERLGNRLAVKMRTGFDSDVGFSALMAAVAKFDLARLTIHGRTRAQGYTGKARWDLIDTASQKMATPVFASGDVTDLTSYDALLTRAPRIRGLIVGRGALRNPWIFQELRERRPVVVTGETIVISLACLSLLIQIEHDNPQSLYDWARHRCGLCVGNQETQWRALYQSLARLAGQKQMNYAPRPELDRFALGRTKLMWGYMRSSLPESWFAPQVFRRRDGPSFFHELSILAQQNNLITLRYNAAHDWLYAGGGKKSASQAQEA